MTQLGPVPALRMHLMQVVASGLKKGRKFKIKGIPGIKKLPGPGIPNMNQSLLQGMKSGGFKSL